MSIFHSLMPANTRPRDFTWFLLNEFEVYIKKKFLLLSLGSQTTNWTKCNTSRKISIYYTRSLWFLACRTRNREKQDNFCLQELISSWEITGSISDAVSLFQCVYRFYTSCLTVMCGRQPWIWFLKKVAKAWRNFVRIIILKQNRYLITNENHLKNLGFTPNQ